jgi:1-acyl-sn-glycerol-3-phosphate acyltransferase
MTEAEARAAGVLPPEGWQAPRPPFPARAMSAIAWSRLYRYASREWRTRHDPGRPEGLERARRFCRGALEALDLELVIRGDDRLPPKERGVLFMWNQTSHLDHLILGAVVDRPVRSLYNIELAKVPVYGDWLRRQKHYLVDRYDEEQWRRSIAQAARDVREQNVSILISPEGTRSWDGKLLPMKRGAFILAIDSGAPIVPIIIRGAHEALPRGSGVIRAGRTIEVEFAEPVPTAGYTQQTRTDLKKRVADVWRLAGAG